MLIVKGLKYLVKAYFFAIEEASGLVGIMIPTILLLFVVLTDIVHVPDARTFVVTMGVFGVIAVVSFLVHILVRRKFIRTPSDYSDYLTPNILLAKNADDSWEMAKIFWRKKEVYPIHLPLSGRSGYHCDVTASFDLDDITIRFEIDAQYEFLNQDRKKWYGYNPQELYENIIKTNHNDLDEWNELRIHGFVTKSPLILQAIESHKNDNPDVLLSHLQDAVRQLHFELPLSNFSHPKVDIEIMLIRSVEVTIAN